MRRIVVCDTGPLLHLGEAGLLFILKQTGEIFIPLQVAEEFNTHAHEFQLPEWIKILELEDSYKNRAAIWRQQIHSGEAAAVALAQQVQAEWLLSDDGKARQFAESIGLEVHGSVGILLWAVAVGQISDQDEAMKYLAALADSTLWMSDRVRQQASITIDDLFSLE